MDTETFGHKLRRMMTERGMNQTALARASGLTQSSVSRIIKDEVKVRPETLRRFAGPLGRTLDEMMVAAGYAAPERVRDEDLNELNSWFRPLSPAGKRLALLICRYADDILGAKSVDEHPFSREDMASHVGEQVFTDAAGTNGPRADGSVFQDDQGKAPAEGHTGRGRAPRRARPRV